MHSSHADALLAEAETFLRLREAYPALARFQVAEAAGADPDRCASGRWTAYMLLGNFEGAWRESDAIRARGAPDPHRFWLGESVDGKRVMLRGLHGFGDTVQALRYAPVLRRRAAKLTVEVAPEFVELARYFDGVDEVITWGKDAPAFTPQWDVQMEVAELPYVFRTQMRDLPLAERYLRVPHDNDSAINAGSSTSLRVGIVWASGEWNASRSVPLELLRPLLQTRDCEFWNLQGGAAWMQLSTLCDIANVHTDPRCAHSLLHLAQSIAGLDLVITPDTLAAHLAGAIGTPAWVMLQHASDWRWMLDRDDSPWYPSLRLFRQCMEGDWRSVIDAVQADLVTLRDTRNEARLVSSL